MSFAKLVLAASTVTDLPRHSPNVLPPRHAAVSLIQHYLDHFLIFSPYLTETRIFGSLEALYESRSAPADRWIVFLIIALSLLSLSVSPEDPKYAEALRYVTGAIEHAETVLLPGSAESIAMVSRSVSNPIFASIEKRVDTASGSICHT